MPRWSRLVLALPLVAILLVAAAIVHVIAARDLAAADLRARERLTLYREMILGELQKYRYLPYVVARDPRANAVLTDPSRAEAASRFLKDLAAASGASALFVMDDEGETLAASNFDQAVSFVGENYAFRPYFTEAIAGNEGRFFAIGATSGEPGFFYSRAAPDDAAPKGVVVVKINMDSLERVWSEGGETVFVSDVNGVVFLTSRPEWRYSTIAPLSDMVFASIRMARQYAGNRLAPLQEGPAGAEELRIAGTAYRQSWLSVGVLGWKIHYLTPKAETGQSAWFVWGGAVALSLVYAVGVLAVRGRRLGKLSAGLRKDADQLRELNQRLVTEIEERLRVERDLRDTQADLAKASRLAAVGQMSAVVAHELNQPLAALRMFVAGARLLLDRGEETALRENLDEIEGLQTRMAALTQELKRFAKPGESRIDTVDLRDCVRNAAKIARPRFEETGVPLEVDLPDVALTAATAPLRVEQVLVNLLRNAVDAVAATDDPAVAIRALRGGDDILVEVVDNGAGIAEDIRDRIFEPFFTTKPSSGGLGLGLSISARIVEDLGGRLDASPMETGGTVFRLSLRGAPTPAAHDADTAERIAVLS